MTVAAACQNHPGREAIGICIECRTRICSECVTKVDGINYCVSCLARLAETKREGRFEARAGASGVLAALAAFGWLLVLTLLAWGLVEAAMPGSG